MNIETTPIILRELLEKTNSTSAFITSSNGLSIFSIQSDDIEEDLLSAFSATIFSVGERLCYQFKEAALNQIILQSNDRQLIVKPISENSYLTLLTSRN